VHNCSSDHPLFINSLLVVCYIIKHEMCTVLSRDSQIYWNGMAVVSLDIHYVGMKLFIKTSEFCTVH
jgi:hypothetical protein